MNPMTQSMTRKDAQQISRNWWILLIVGIITAIAGLVVLSVNWTIVALSVFVAILFIFKGLGMALTPSLAGGSRAWNVFLGFLGILVGIAILLFPTFAVLTLVIFALFVGVWLTVWGIALTVSASANRYLVSYWWLGLAIGIVSIALGVLVLFNPILSLKVAVFLIGVWAILSGVGEIALSFEARTLSNEMASIEEAGKRRDKAA